MAVEDHVLYGEPDFACARVARVRVSSTVGDNYPARLQQQHLEAYLCERAAELRGDALVGLRIEVSRWQRLLRRRRMTLHGRVVRFTGVPPEPPSVDLRATLPHLGHAPDRDTNPARPTRPLSDSAPLEGER